jgi:Nucleotidyl transferase AbiEii toxin, Type IV TA system
MIDKREILEAASSFSLLPNIVEKDYVLGWILAGIDAHEELAESWVFKGGTCLKKCYFGLTVSRKIWISLCAMKVILMRNSSSRYSGKSLPGSRNNPD